MAITFTVAYPGSAYPGEDPFLIDGTDPGPTSVTIDNENTGVVLGTQVNWPYGPSVACTITITGGSAEELALIKIGMNGGAGVTYLYGSGGIYTSYSGSPFVLVHATDALEVGDVIGLRNDELQYESGAFKLNGTEYSSLDDFYVGPDAAIEQISAFPGPDPDPSSEFWTGFNQSYEVP